MAPLRKSLLALCLLVLSLSLAAARAQSASATEELAGETPIEDTVADVEDAAVAEEEEAAAEAPLEPDTAAVEEPLKKPGQYPFRDLPADVLRDFPGLCFGSTALRLFQVSQSWSLTPFCGVATCLVSRDGFHLIERVQDCGPQPKRNARCTNVNARSESPFPRCCPAFECEEGVELEYPTQDELQQLAHEAAQAAVRAQYEDIEEAEGDVQQTGRVSPQEEETLPDSAPLEEVPVVVEVVEVTTEENTPTTEQTL